MNEAWESAHADAIKGRGAILQAVGEVSHSLRGLCQRFSGQPELEAFVDYRVHTPSL
jgi:hypothetical protein